jgi:exopolysaccharide biosynthesis polyprenyl glycosylphosphotransferase
MNELRKKILARGTLVLDLSIACAAWMTSVSIHPSQNAPLKWNDGVSLQIHIPSLIGVILTLGAWALLFHKFHLYQRRRLDNRVREWIDIVSAVSLGVMFYTAQAFLLTPQITTRERVLTFWLLALAGTLLSRTAVRQFLQYLRHRGRNLRYVVFVGSGPRSVLMAYRLLDRPELGYRLLGFVDNRFVSDENILPSDLRLCSLNAFPDYLETHAVDEVFISLPVKSCYTQILETVRLCQELGVTCRISSDWFALKPEKSVSYQIDGEPILTINATPNPAMRYLWIKRWLDVVLGTLMLVLSLPVWGLTAVLIKATSAGPVLFKQKRVGYNRRHFTIYKFRTMVDGAEAIQGKLCSLNEADGPTFKIENDPRITVVGKWLRRTSLDELPQLINVLKGDMSLVGPRPLPLRDVAGFDQRRDKRRFSMRPGITCLWQIRGRNRIPFREWMRLDLEYIDSWSPLLDIKILFRTLPTVFKSTGQ